MGVPNILVVAETALEAEEIAFELEETPSGTEDDCEGDGGMRL